VLFGERTDALVHDAQRIDFLRVDGG